MKRPECMMRALWRDLLVHVGLFGILVVGAPAWASALWDPVTEVEGMQVARRLLGDRAL